MHECVFQYYSEEFIKLHISFEKLGEGGGYHDSLVDKANDQEPNYQYLIKGVKSYFLKSFCNILHFFKIFTYELYFTHHHTCFYKNFPLFKPDYAHISLFMCSETS